MNNVRGLYPPLYGATPSGGGGGGGQRIQVDALPEASLQYKDKIVQYVGASTETITNGYFYKCVEHTETEGETITVTYSWDPVAVMEVESGGYKLVASVQCDGVKTYRELFSELMNNVTISSDVTYLLKVVGNSALYHETSRPVNSNSLGFYQTFSVGSTTYTDNILISKTSSEVRYTKDGNDVSSYVPSNDLIIKLFSISVDSTI